MKRFFALTLALFLLLPVLPARAESLPDLPVSAEFRAQDVSFKAGEKYAVYSAPDENSLRGAGGKAAVSTDGAVRVYGWENGWLLIEYPIDAAHDRIGYIQPGAFSGTAEALRFSDMEAVAKADLTVTDDPLGAGAKLASLRAGQSVRWLGTLGSWAYIAWEKGRGFVPVSGLALSALDRPHVFSVCIDEEGEACDLFEVCRLRFDESGRVCAVTGRYERVGLDDDLECYAPFYTREEFTYPLAEGFEAAMLNSMYLPDDEDDWLRLTPAADLARWWIAAYLPDEPADTALVFDYDFPDTPWDERETNFWFFTAKIELNAAGEIVYMEYAYVPWA